MPDAFAANNQIVAIDLDFSPDDRASLGGQPSKIHQLSLARDLSKGGAISLSNGDKLAAAVRPAPRARSLAAITAKLLVRLEVVHVDVLALVGLVRVAFYGYGLAVLAGNDVLVGTLLFEAIPLLVVVVAGFLVVCPSSLHWSV